MAQGAVFNNTGRFEALSGAGLEHRFGGEATFLNAGTFVKTGAGTTTSISGVTFNNSGTVDVQSGTLSLAGGGTSSGRFTIGGGGTLEFAGGVSTLSTLTSASSVAGSGVLGFTGGTTDILGTYLATGPLLFTGGNATFITANSISTPSLTIRGGTGTFNSQLTADSVTLTGGTGTINSSLTAGSLSLSGGTLNIASAATLDLNGSTFKIIDGGVLNNAGVATWRSTGEFRLDSGGVINNTGRFEAQTDQAIVHTGPLGTVNNLGTFAKTGGTGTTSITANFNNTGRVDLLSGTLALSGGGLSSGTFNIAAGTSLALGPDPGVVGAAGLHDLTAAASLVGGGGVLVTQNVRFGAGSVYRLIGTTTLTSGTLTAIADLIALGAGETFSPSAAILVRNGGVVTVTGSFVDVAAGGALNGASAASLLVLNGGVGAGPATFGGLLHVVASSLANGPAVQAMVSLAGPLAMVTGSTLTTTSDLVGVLNGAQVVPPMPNPNLDQPFVTLDNSTVTAAGNVLTVRGSLAGVPSRMTLTGPLFVANNSSVSSAGGFVIDQGAELTGKSSGDLIRLVNSTFTSGPAALANFFAVFSDPLGTPSSVSLKGRLLSLDNGSTVSAPFSLLSVFRSSFSSDTSNALIEAVNSVLTLGRDSTQPGGQTLGRLLTVTASPTVPATVALSGPLAALTGTNVTATEILVGIFGGSVSRMTNGELIQLTDSTVKIGSSIPGQEIFGRALFITGQGGPDGTASLSLNGPLLSSLNGALTVTGRLVEILPGAQVTAGTGDAPLVSITGGIHSIGTLDGSSIFRVQGREGQEVLDEPLKTSRTLLATSGATISSPSGVNFDTMLFNATAPIFSAINSNLTLTSGPAISLNASTLSFKTSMNDAVISLAANSVLRVTGDLFSLSNGGKLIAMGGPLIRVDGSVLDVTGAFAAFRGTGNLISVNNNLCSTGCITFPGGSTGDITVKLVGPGSSAIIASNPFKGPGTGTLERIGNAAVIEVLNGGKVTIGPR